MYRQERPESFNIGQLFHFLWDHDLDVSITYTNGVSSNGQNFDSTTITAITQSLLEGQMMLKASQSHISTVAIDYDGTGGAFGWRRAEDFGRWPRVMTPDHDQHHGFTAEDGGRRLILVRQKLNSVGLQSS